METVSKIGPQEKIRKIMIIRKIEIRKIEFRLYIYTCLSLRVLHDPPVSLPDGEPVLVVLAGREAAGLGLVLGAADVHHVGVGRQQALGLLPGPAHGQLDAGGGGERGGNSTRFLVYYNSTLFFIHTVNFYMYYVVNFQI